MHDIALREYRSSFEHTLLAELVANVSAQGTSNQAPLTGFDRWILASQLQKAIRRGRGEIAVAAGLGLLEIDREVLWRRLRIIAAEDIGIGDVSLVASVLAIAGKRTFQDRVGLHDVTRYVITRLAAAVKSRTACDLACLAERAVLCEVDLLSADVEYQMRVACDDSQPLWRRAVALRLLGGWSIRDAGYRFKTLSRCHAQGLSDVALNLGCSSAVGYIAVAGRNTEGLNTTMLLADALTPGDKTEVSQLLPFGDCLTMIGPLLPATFCMYTRIGKEANRRFLLQNDNLRRQLLTAGASNAARALGFLIFHMEGSLLDRTLDSAIARSTRSEIERLELSDQGVRDDAVDELKVMIADSWPLLNAVRREVLCDLQSPVPSLAAT